MKRTGLFVAMLAVSGFALTESNAHAAFRWPWEAHQPAAPKPAIPAKPVATPVAQQPVAVPQGPEQQFAAKIHEVNQKEIAFGNLALSWADDARVKQYAKMLIDDHTKVDAEMMQRANELRMTFPAPVAIAHDSDYQALTTKSGADFDIAFLDAMVRGHDALIPDLARFKEQESDHPFHAELVTLFDTVKHHREAAKELLDSERQEKHSVKGTEPPRRPVAPFGPKINR